MRRRPQMTKISKPIIILGTGRCGSTVFHRLLARHPRTMWLSGLSDRFPTRTDWNRRAVSVMHQPLLRRLFGGKVQPSEAYLFWDYHAYGFSAPCRDLVRGDVTARVRKQVRGALEPMLTPAHDRLLLKITGWPRIGYLREIFEDARFVHIVRDGRAVASSLLHVDFWRGWQGPHGWRAGLLSPEDQAAWEGYARSFVALAGLEWRIQMRAIDAARRRIGPRPVSRDQVRGLLPPAVGDLSPGAGVRRVAVVTGVRARGQGRAHPRHDQPLAGRSHPAAAGPARRPAPRGSPPVRLPGRRPSRTRPCGRGPLATLDSS